MANGKGSHSETQVQHVGKSQPYVASGSVLDKVARH